MQWLIGAAVVVGLVALTIDDWGRDFTGTFAEISADAPQEDLRPFAAHLIECFGPARLMWGSDWPVVELAGGHRTWWQASEGLLAELTQAERAEILGNTAARFYSI